MEKLAIVGAGIAGLGCAHFLQNDFDLTVFEKDSHAGGHAFAVPTAHGDKTFLIDTGFMVFNFVTYPNLTRLFGELGVEVQASPMSFSVNIEKENLEYCGSSWNQLYAQRKNIFKLRFHRMLLEIYRFNKIAVKALTQPEHDSLTMDEFLRKYNFNRDLAVWYLLPMSSAVWSTPPGEMLKFPAMTLIRFFHNHGFLGMYTQHPWFTVKGSSAGYVKKLIRPFQNKIKAGKKIKSIRRFPDSAEILFENGDKESFDRIILASHADQSLEMLDSPEAAEEVLLRHFKYQKNPTILHWDESVMPKTKRAWASWNYKINAHHEPSVHYWANKLQGTPSDRNYFVSLNPDEIDPLKIVRHIPYEHPIFSLNAVNAQPDLHKLNKRRGTRIFFCGSYFKYGFHEDAFTSALELCRILLQRPLWQ